MGDARVKIYIAKKMKSWNLVEGHNLFIFALFGKLEQQFPKKRIGCIGGSWHSDIDLAVFFVFFNILYHLKTTAFSYSRSPSIRILKKAKTKSSIFKFWDWRNLFSYSLPSLYSEKKLEEPKRPPKSMDTLS